MKRLPGLLVLVWMVIGCWVLPASAQPNAEAILLPVELPGYYTPIHSDQMTQRLEKRLQQLAKKVRVQLARRADLTIYQYTPGGEQPPSNQLAEQICRGYKANYLCWASIRFQPNYDPATHSLAMAGAARVWIYSQSDGKALIDQPLSLVRSGPVANVKDQTASLKVAQNLASGCVDDLGMQLVYIAQQSKSQAANQSQMATWKPAQAQPQFSQNYKNMVKAIDAYMKATNKQDLIDVTNTQQNMSNLWLTLNKPEQDAVTNNYPGVVRLLVAPVYNGWPYYY